MKFLIFLALAAHAKSTILCGVRSGNATNAYLVDGNNKRVVTLAQKGKGDALLVQADEKWKGGLQSGVHYCVVVKLDADGKPEKILKVTRQHK